MSREEAPRIVATNVNGPWCIFLYGGEDDDGEPDCIFLSDMPDEKTARAVAKRATDWFATNWSGLVENQSYLRDQLASTCAYLNMVKDDADRRVAEAVEQERERAAKVAEWLAESSRSRNDRSQAFDYTTVAVHIRSLSNPQSFASQALSRVPTSSAVEVPRPEVCPHVRNGRCIACKPGRLDEACMRCGGSGELKQSVGRYLRCPTCNGSGYVVKTSKEREEQHEQGIHGAHADRPGKGESEGDRGSVRHVPGETSGGVSPRSRTGDRSDEVGGSGVLREEGDGIDPGKRNAADVNSPASTDLDSWVRWVDIQNVTGQHAEGIMVGDVHLDTFHNPKGADRFVEKLRDGLRPLLAAVRAEALEAAAKKCDKLRDANYGRDQAWGVADDLGRSIRAMVKP